MDYLEELNQRLKEENYDPSYIDNVIQYTGNLLKKNIPVIFNIEHLALYLGISENSVKEIANNSFMYYWENKKHKRNKRDIRTLHIPKKELKIIHKFILVNILNEIKTSENATGFKLNCSIKKNASKHVNQKYVLTIDLEDFFTNINVEKIRNVFLEIGYNREVSEVLSKLCTVKGFLPQGASTSPYLSNLVCIKLDETLNNYCEKNQINFTRYADDLTFSSNTESVKSVDNLKRLITILGFKINHKKTRLITQNKQQKVTGLVVNKKVNISRKYIKELRAEIYYCNKFGVNGHMRRKNIYYSNYKHHLYGKAYYVKMINKELGEKFIKQINEISWDY